MGPESEQQRPHVEVLLHEAMQGRLNEKIVSKLDPQTQYLLRTIHRRYRKRVNAEMELRRMRSNRERSSSRPENFIFELLADYAIDLAVIREEKAPVSQKEHSQRLQRIWRGYRDRVLRYGW